MVFASPIFLYLFLPLVLVGAGLSGRRFRNVFLLLASLFFYSWGEARLVVVMLGSALTDYLAALFIAYNGKPRWREIPEQSTIGATRSRKQWLALILSLVVNLGLLIFFKYANFGLDAARQIFSVLGFGANVPSHLNILLPLGISFYTFQSMSYSIDVFRGQTRATRNPIDFLAFVTLFPQLIAGPIVRYSDVAAELIERHVSLHDLAEGIRRFTVGLGKKILIANTLAVSADAIFSLRSDQLTTPVAWFGVIAYALQIYFDFSGYSDMAIGLGRMFGFHFLENFNFPYIANSIRDFWRRWHISLSTWFRDYLYIPLGGNRLGTGRTYLNLLFVFFVTGLWHGASWTFVTWGLFYGVFLMIERLWPTRLSARWLRPFGHVYTLLVVLCAWVLFRADSLTGAFNFFRAMFGLQGTAAVPLIYYLNGKTSIALVFGLMGSVPLLRSIGRYIERRFQPQLGEHGVMVLVQAVSTVFLAGVFVLAIMQLASGSYNPFIYYRF